MTEDYQLICMKIVIVCYINHNLFHSSDEQSLIICIDEDKNDQHAFLLRCAKNTFTYCLFVSCEINLSFMDDDHRVYNI